MTKYVHSTVIDSKPSRPAKPCGYTFLPRRPRPNPVLNFLARRYRNDADPSGLPRQLDMLA